jgi:hypothetical protein
MHRVRIGKRLATIRGTARGPGPARSCQSEPLTRPRRCMTPMAKTNCAAVPKDRTDEFGGLLRCHRTAPDHEHCVTSGLCSIWA